MPRSPRNRCGTSARSRWSPSCCTPPFRSCVRGRSRAPRLSVGQLTPALAADLFIAALRYGLSAAASHDAPVAFHLGAPLAAMSYSASRYRILPRPAPAGAADPPVHHPGAGAAAHRLSGRPARRDGHHAGALWTRSARPRRERALRHRPPGGAADLSRGLCRHVAHRPERRRRAPCPAGAFRGPRGGRRARLPWPMAWVPAAFCWPHGPPG